MPIISIKTNHSLTSHQKEQLQNDVVTATSEPLSVDKARIDASLQIISPDASVSCGKYKAPFIRYGVMMLAGRSLEAKQALVKRYDEAAKNIIAGGDMDVKTHHPGSATDRFGARRYAAGVTENPQSIDCSSTRQSHFIQRAVPGDPCRNI